MDSIELKLNVYTDLDEAKTPWQAIEAKGHLYIFQTYQWLLNYYEHVGRRSNIRPFLIDVTLSSGEPLYFFPFAVSEGKRFKTLQWMGGVLVDYGAPIVSDVAYDLAGKNELDFPLVWSRVLELLHDVDAIWLSKIPEAIEEYPNPMLKLSCRPYRTKAYHSSTSCNWIAFYEAKAGAKTRSTDRRKKRRLSEEGELDFRFSDGKIDEDFERITGAMIEQKQARYQSIHASNILAREGYKDFFLNPISSLRKSGMLHVSALILDKRALAAHWGMIYRKRFYYYMPSFAGGRWARYSPGRLLLIKLLQFCAEGEIELFDFTIGDESYKKDWYDFKSPLFEYFKPISKMGRVLGILYLPYSFLAGKNYFLALVRRMRKMLYLSG